MYRDWWFGIIYSCKVYAISYMIIQNTSLPNFGAEVGQCKTIHGPSDMIGSLGLQDNRKNAFCGLFNMGTSSAK